jgi:RNA 3'-terminal phosphate cyclase-like protein
VGFWPRDARRTKAGVLMGRDKIRRLSGSRHPRQQLVLATLTSTDDIRSGDAVLGLRSYEVSLLRLLGKISNHHTIDLNESR